MDRVLQKTKKIALVAHDNKKLDLMEWAKFNRDTLAEHELYATGTTGALLDKELGLNVQKLLSGPDGPGDGRKRGKILRTS